MATLTVIYPLTEGSTFDQEYYASIHMPMARSAWNEFGLQSYEILFPATGPQPLAGMVIMRFNDQAGIDAALTCPQMAELLRDVPNYTNIAPVIYRAND